METFKKRQKEMRRLEKQRDKFAKRMERKLHPLSETESPEGSPADTPVGAESGEPQAGETPAAEPRAEQ